MLFRSNFAGGTPLRDDSTLLKANAARFRIPLTLYPIGDVICNKDSDFPESDKIDRSIERFMRSWSIKGASFALMKMENSFTVKAMDMLTKKQISRQMCSMFSGLLLFLNSLQQWVL